MSKSNSFIIIEPFRVEPCWLDELSELFFIQNKVSTKNTGYQDHTEFELINQFNSCRNEQDALKVLANMWRESQFCDLILACENHEHLAHRCALGFHSSKYK